MNNLDLRQTRHTPVFNCILYHYAVILSNEMILLMVGFVGIAGIMLVAIGNSYDDTIQSIQHMTETAESRMQERIGILDVQSMNENTFVTIVNYAQRPVTITEFWDEDGSEILCKDSSGALDDRDFVIPANSDRTIHCIQDEKRDIILLSANYNIVRISP